MDNVFTYIRETRKALKTIVEGLSTDTLNSIPEGFNNNIIWNFGHIYVATLGLTYLRTGVDKGKEIPYGKKYTKGAKPDFYIHSDEITFLKEQVLSSIDALETDYKNNLFSKIEPFATDTYGKTMNTIEEVITCTLAHDNFHFGYVKALQRAILTSPIHLPQNQQQ